MDRESTRIRAAGQKSARDKELDETFAEISRLEAKVRRIQQENSNVENREDGECSSSSSEEEDHTMDTSGNSPRVSEKTFKDLTAIMADQNRSVAKLAARQVGVKELPRFSGSVDEWPIFHAQYINTTKLCGYKSVENVSRLEKSLSGEARSSVATLLTIPTSADTIIEVLKRRYGNPRQQLQRLITRAIQAAPPKDDKPLTIVDFATEVRNVAFALQTLDEGRYLENSTILDEFEKKLSPIMRNLWAEVIYVNKHYNVMDLTAWLDQRAELAMTIAPVESSPPPRPKPGQNEEKNPKTRSRGAVFTVTASGNRKCVICDEEHYVTACPQFRAMTPAQRLDNINKKNLCRACLGRNHRLFVCRRRRECGIEGCKQFHHRFLHPRGEVKAEASGKTKIAGDAPGQATNFGLSKDSGVRVTNYQISECKLYESVTNPCENVEFERDSTIHNVNDIGNNEKKLEVIEDVQEGIDSTSYLYRICASAKASSGNIVMLRIAPVIVKNSQTGDVFETYAMLDSGATVTLIAGGLMRKLALEGRPTSMNLQWLDGTMHNESVVNQVSFDIKGQHTRAQWYKINDCYAVDHLRLPEVNVRKEELIRKYPYLSKVEFKSISSERPEILIGENNAALIATHQLVHDANNKPIASLTALGWVISGIIENRPLKARTSRVVCPTSEIKDLVELIKASFSLDNIGIKIPIKPILSREDEEALKILEATSKRVGNRFEVGLLWKNPRGPMPLSRPGAVCRDQQIQAKMERDPQFAQAYQERMQSQIDQKRLIPLDENDKIIPAEDTWYLPHFPVINPNKPGKVRIVFDAAAEVDGVSLNSCLHSGPNQVASLPSVLIQFRTGDFGFTGDIKDMFPQILIREQDQNFQRIVYKGLDYKMTAMTFGATCSPASAAYIKDKNAAEWKNSFPEAYHEIATKHYVDDYLGSHDDEKKAITLICDVIEVHRRGGFEIRNFVSSSQKILEGIPKELRMHSAMVDMSVDQQFEKVLGLWWEPLTDIFSFRCQQSISTDSIPTKRQALRTLMKVYDPLGFAAQFIIRGRIIFQQIWRSGVEWDEKISEESYQAWKAWTMQLAQLSEIEIPRCLAPLVWRGGQMELHVFTDASEDAMAAVAYLRCVTEEAVYVSFVMAKAKVAPLRAVSIPRLELQGALIGSRLASFIRNEYKIEIQQRVFWTDAKIVLHWIQSDSRSFKPFVANRVSEIQDTTEPCEWRWIATDLNVADIATRNRGSTEFTPDSTWYRGPEFLHSRDYEWSRPNGDSDNEVDKEFVGVAFNANWSSPIDSTKYMKWNHVHKVMSYVFRFIRACREQWRSRPTFSSDPPSKALSATDWKGGEQYLLRIAQCESFCFNIKVDESTSSEEPQPLTVDAGNMLYKYNPLMHQDGLIRVDGRINRMPRVSPEFRNPIILYAKNRIVHLLLMSYHERLGHWGVDFTLSEVRTRFLVIGGRVMLKKIQRGCKRCQLQKLKPQVPLMGQLPPERLESHVVPFHYTGCDMFGPIYAQRGRSELKRYGCIFTCLTTRAVHLELCNSLSTDSFMMALRRFYARRTLPAKIFSDCGSNFKGADKELREEASKLDQAQIVEKMAQIGVEWKFNPPYAPHMGGCWERMVALVKKSIKQATELSKHPPSEEVLATLFAEAENIVNSRPLLILADSGESLTPNHFLKHQKSTLTSGGEFSDKDLILRKEWRKAQRLTDHFWQIWLKYYSPTLTTRPKWRMDVNPVKTGDRVVIVDPNMPRNHWPTERIIKVTKSRDGRIRVVKVKMDEDGIEYTRPVSRLAVLEPSSILMNQQ